MNSLLINNIAFLLVPIAIFALLVVSLVLLFARENAQVVLRQLYIYGVAITAFIISCVAMIGILYTGLTTTLFPVTQNSQSVSRFDSPVSGMFTDSATEEVKAYLQEQQERFTILADTEDVRQEWRGQLAWSVPLLLVFLPILFSYRRFLTHA